MAVLLVLHTFNQWIDGLLWTNHTQQSAMSESLLVSWKNKITSSQLRTVSAI